MASYGLGGDNFVDAAMSISCIWECWMFIEALNTRVLYIHLGCFG